MAAQLALKRVVLVIWKSKMRCAPMVPHTDMRRRAPLHVANARYYSGDILRYNMHVPSRVGRAWQSIWQAGTTSARTTRPRCCRGVAAAGGGVLPGALRAGWEGVAWPKRKGHSAFLVAESAHPKGGQRPAVACGCDAGPAGTHAPAGTWALKGSGAGVGRRQQAHSARECERSRLRGARKGKPAWWEFQRGWLGTSP